MATSSVPRSGRSTPPKDLAQTPPPANFDQFAVMQSIMEIHKDVAKLTHSTDQIIADLKDLKGATTDLKSKVGRAEAIVVVGGGLLVVFAVFLWWLFAAPITYMRDQMINQQPQISQPATLTPSTPATIAAP